MSLSRTISVSFAAATVLLFVCLASSVDGLQDNTTTPATTTTTTTPAMTPAPSPANDNSTASTAKVTNSMTTLKTNATSMVMCYNETSPSNNTCHSASGMCYVTFNMTTGASGYACKPSATSSTCSANFASTAGTVAGRCEFCCMTNLCNRDRDSTWMRTACCSVALNQNQSGCPSGASRHVTMTSAVVVVVYVIMLVGKLGSVQE